MYRSPLRAYLEREEGRKEKVRRTLSIDLAVMRYPFTAISRGKELPQQLFGRHEKREKKKKEGKEENNKSKNLHSSLRREERGKEGRKRVLHALSPPSFYLQVTSPSVSIREKRKEEEKVLPKPLPRVEKKEGTSANLIFVKGGSRKEKKEEEISKSRRLPGRKRERKKLFRLAGMR